MRPTPPGRLSLAVLLAAFLTIASGGCTGSEIDMEQEALNDFAEQYAEAWSSQDAEFLASYYAPEGRLQINDGEPAIGREAIEEVAQSFMTAHPDMRVFLNELTVVDGVPQFHWTLIATNSGPGGNGNRVHVSGYEAWTLNDEGQIVESLGHMDTAEYERQLEFGYDGE